MSRAERVLALTEDVKRLNGLLPICSYFKKIRYEAGRGGKAGPPRWLPVEEYLAERSGTLLSHGVCPECLEFQGR